MFLIASAVSAELQQPERTIGYFIGDILQQKVRLDPGDRVMVDADLESGERIDEYLYRLPVVPLVPSSWIGRQLNWLRQLWAAVYDGGESGRAALNIRYQVTNVPPVTRTISLPELVLVTESNSTVLIPTWQFNIGPLTQDAAASDQGNLIGQQSSRAIESRLMPDRTALEMFSVRGGQRFKARLVVLTGMLCTILLCWFLWWSYRNFKDRRVLPFARARSAIRALPRSQRKSADAAWRILHAAFNDTAGRTIGIGSLPELLQRAPWLNTVSDDIELFYRASTERFFSQSNSAPNVNVASLTEALFQLEKRQVPSMLPSVAREQGPSHAGSDVNHSGKDSSNSIAD